MDQQPIQTRNDPKDETARDESGRGGSSRTDRSNGREPEIPRKGRGKGKGAKRKKLTRKVARKLTAKTADRHLLYESSVQCAEHEVEFVTDTFRKVAGRRPRSLREDFCGTALVCAEWVRSKKDRTAVGVDLDPSVLAWGREHRIEPLGKKAERVTLRNSNVLDPPAERFDAIVAFNYSYFVFKTREQMLEYFRSVHGSLADDGVFFLDAYGGTEAQETLREKRKEKGFTYVWHQAYFNPIDNHVINYIHFHFRDGSKMKRAFTYDWRLWQLPELRELLAEAGFPHVQVYWEDEDKKGEGLGTWSPVDEAENDAGWNVYLVAAKQKPKK